MLFKIRGPTLDGWLPGVTVVTLTLMREDRQLYSGSEDAFEARCNVSCIDALNVKRVTMSDFYFTQPRATGLMLDLQADGSLPRPTPLFLAMVSFC